MPWYDIGFYGEDEQRPERIAAFVDTWSDRFAVDAAGDLLVGAKARMCSAIPSTMVLRGAVDVTRPVAVFIHSSRWSTRPPIVGQARCRGGCCLRCGGRRADVPLVASGHRHRYADRARRVGAVDDHREKRDEWQ